MAKLTSRQRRRLRKDQFALPSKRKYPIHDKEHAKSALAYAKRKDTEGSYSTVRRRVLKKYPELKKPGGRKKKKN